MNCSTCAHYELYKMITGNRPYGYSGDIPCLRCSRFTAKSDEYVPKTSATEFVWDKETYVKEVPNG